MCSNNLHFKNSSPHPSKIQKNVMIQNKMNTQTQITQSDPSHHHVTMYNQSVHPQTITNERSYDQSFHKNDLQDRIQVNSSINNSTRTKPNQAFSNQPNSNHYHSEEHHNEIAKQNLDQQFANLRLKEYEKTIKTIQSVRTWFGARTWFGVRTW